MSQINSYAYYESNQSLLSMLNKSSNSDSLLNQIISDNETKYQETMEKMGYSSSSGSSKYESTETAVTSVLDAISALNTDSLYVASEETGEYDNSSLIKAVSNFTTAYNSTITNLTNCGGALNTKFSEQLEEAFSDNEEALEAIGITRSDDGKLTVDQDKLAKSEASAIKTVLGSGATYMTAVKSSISDIDEILDKALSYSSTYTSSGTYTS